MKFGNNFCPTAVKSPVAANPETGLLKVTCAFVAQKTNLVNCVVNCSQKCWY